MNKTITSIIMLVSSTVFAVNSDYKKHMMLVLEGDSSGYTFVAPDDVYLKSYYSDLRDMRVINATGDYVPMRTFFSTDQIVHEYSQTTLPLFKLNKTMRTPVESKQTRTTIAGTHEDYTVTTSKSLDHFLDTLEVEDPNQIIIDAAILKGQKIENLEIQWQYKTQGNRIFTVDLSASNDLSQWISIKKKQQLIEINTNSRTLLENKIAVNHQAYTFYKITFTDGVVPKVTQIKAWLVNQEIKKSQQIKQVNEYSIVNNNTLQFNTGGVYTVESFTISFNQENTLTDLSLYSRNKLKGKWRQAGRGTIYSLTSNGVDIKNNTIKIKQSSDRFWQMRFDENINIKSVNKIAMNGRRHQVEFLAQGQAPFTLVYSNPNKLKAVSRSWYYKMPEDLRSKIFSSKVTLKDSNKSSAPAIRSITEESANNTNFAKWVFWLVLTIVLLFLGVMAYKLISETSDN